MSEVQLNQIGPRAWQEAIINKVDFTTAEPGSPGVGDRYINTVTGTSSGTAQSVTANYIYEWNGLLWVEVIPTVGYATWDVAAGEYFSFTGSAWGPFDDTISILDLTKYVAVSPSGNAGFSALNVNKPITSLITAMSKASAFSPTFTNPVLVDVLDGDDYVLGGSFTVPTYTALYMRGATLNGSDVVLSDYSATNIIRHSVSGIGYNKTAGSNEAFVNVIGRFFVGTAEGFRCTSGRIDASAKTIEVTSGDVIAEFTSGDINLDVPGKISVTSTGTVTEHGSTGRVNLRLNDVEVNADAFNMNAGSGYNTLYANRVKAGGQAFDISNAGKVLSGIFCEVEEVVASDTTYMNYMVATYRRSGDAHDGYAVIKNSQKGIVLSAPDIKAGLTQPFINLSTTPVATFTFNKNTSYKMILEATDGRSNIWTMDVAYNSGVPELIFADFNEVNGAVIQSPAGTFNITITGFVTASYNLVITPATGAATLAATSATTGTTTLQIIPLSGV